MLSKCVKGGVIASYNQRGLILSSQVQPLSVCVRLAFAWTRAEHIPLLLGQVNFLKDFQVCFFGYQP
jgi:hypothetical protein